ncbi:MAG: phosphatase PAP2 family protein [Gemmatimonadales bacterium]|nr:phosphatase PAP2 family protein [Gemmatimonadales bacterium]
MWIVIGLFLICAWLVWPGKSRSRQDFDPVFVRTGSQWRRNYGRRSFLRLGGAVAASGLLAWTGADEVCNSFHSDVVRSRTSDGVARLVKHLGERFWFLNWGLLALLDGWVRTSWLSRWGRDNFEAMVVGLPTLWILQRGLGANRPSSEDANPRWRPLRADNSASGHAFMAAVPLLHLAHRLGPASARYLARAASALTGWSRINDEKHYLGQVVLGWVIAWNAVESTRDQDKT